MAKDNKYDKSVMQCFALITQFGITMLVPIFLCSFLGWFLDQKLQTSFLFVLLFFIGALAGFRNIFILAKKVSKPSKTSEYEETRKRLQQERTSYKDNIHKKGDEKDEEQ